MARYRKTENGWIKTDGADNSREEIIKSATLTLTTSSTGSAGLNITPSQRVVIGGTTDRTNCFASFGVAENGDWVAQFKNAGGTALTKTSITLTYYYLDVE